MLYLFLILLVLAAVALGFVVLIQNPKGGGLSGTVAGINTQFMGVKQTTDVLERGTWLFAGIIAALCIFSTLFFKGAATDEASPLDRLNTTPQTQQQAPAASPAPAATPGAGQTAPAK